MIEATDLGRLYTAASRIGIDPLVPVGRLWIPAKFSVAITVSKLAKQELFRLCLLLTAIVI